MQRMQARLHIESASPRPTDWVEEEPASSYHEIEGEPD